MMVNQLIYTESNMSAYQGMQDKYQYNGGTFILLANDGICETLANK